MEDEEEDVSSYLLPYGKEKPELEALERIRWSNLF